MRCPRTISKPAALTSGLGAGLTLGGGANAAVGASRTRLDASDSSLLVSALSSSRPAVKRASNGIATRS